jgi:hypothetical protein
MCSSPEVEGLQRLHRFLRRWLEVVRSGLVKHRTTIPNDERPHLHHAADVHRSLAGVSVRAATRKVGAAKWVLEPMGAATANGQHCPITTE